MILIKGIEEINCIFGNGATSDELITYFNEFWNHESTIFVKVSLFIYSYVLQV